MTRQNDFDFGKLAGVALIVLALIGPIAFCTAQRGGPTSINDVHKACIEKLGEWETPAWGGPRCHWPKDQLAK